MIERVSFAGYAPENEPELMNCEQSPKNSFRLLSRWGFLAAFDMGGETELKLICLLG